MADRFRQVALYKLRVHTAALNDSPKFRQADSILRRIEDELVEAVKQYAVVTGQTALEAMIELQRTLARETAPPAETEESYFGREYRP